MLIQGSYWLESSGLESKTNRGMVVKLSKVLLASLFKPLGTVADPGENLTGAPILSVVGVVGVASMKVGFMR